MRAPTWLGIKLPDHSSLAASSSTSLAGKFHPEPEFSEQLWQPCIGRRPQLWQLVEPSAGRSQLLPIAQLPGQTAHQSLSRQLKLQQHTQTMLPRNESLRKFLVVFSFFETFCTRVGNSERFGQGRHFLILLLVFSWYFLTVGGRINAWWKRGQLGDNPDDLCKSFPQARCGEVVLQGIFSLS